MCGRLNIYDPELIMDILLGIDFPAYPHQEPRYNVCPQESVPVLSADKQFSNLEWGIQFHWGRHPNTRVDTVKKRTNLQRLLTANRCLVPVNRFYEWPDAKTRPKYKTIKTRFCIHSQSDVLLLGGFVNDQQFNILTTGPTPAINEFHHHSPVIIQPEQAYAWLASDIDDLYPLMQPTQTPLTIYECDPYVNNGRNKGPRCMAPLSV